MNNRELTLYEAFYKSANENLKETALIYQHKKFSYHHVLNKVNSLASALTALGFRRDDVITVMLPNIPGSVYLLYAINQIGAIANLVHPLMKLPQLKEIMIETKSRILFTLDSRINEFEELKSNGITLYSASPIDELNVFKKIYYKNKVKPVDFDNKLSDLYTYKMRTNYDRSFLKDCVYLHSGGTTGESKVIALSAFAINSLSVSGLKILNVESGHDMGMLSVLPMFHGFGLAMGIHVSLIFGAYDVLMPKFHTKEVISYLRKNQLQTLIGVPSLYEALLRNNSFSYRNLKGIKNAFVGGDFVPESLFDRFNERMKQAGSSAKLFEGYGLTETVTVCSVNTKTANKDKTVGKAIEHARVRAFDEKLNELPPDALGELCVSGDTLMNGYRFEKVALNPFFLDKNRCKWVRTGDYGKLDSEGYVYFVQRLKRVVKVSGINVYPSMIENEIMKFPYVFECYVDSVQDIRRGNMLKLYLVLDNKYKGRNFNKEINDAIIDKFGIYALPKEIRYLEKFPKTLVGKIDANKLKELD